MLSAPAAIPAISSDSPACSANAITGTIPACDTRLSSSNSGCARDQPSGNFTVSAFLDCVNQDLDNPDSLDPEGTSTFNAPQVALPVHGSRLINGYDPQARSVNA